MRPRGCSTSMSAIALFESLLVCFEQCCDRRRGLVGCCGAVCAFGAFGALGALQLCFVWRRGQATRGSQLVYLYALASQQRWYAVQLIYVATAAVLIRAP